MTRKAEKPDFEHSLSELESLVVRLEQGDLPIEEALKAFEQGVRLTRECQTILQQAEQKVQLLTEQDGEIRVSDFPTARDE